jgi:hypothetical protein
LLFRGRRSEPSTGTRRARLRAVEARGSAREQNREQNEDEMELTTTNQHSALREALMEDDTRLQRAFEELLAAFRERAPQTSLYTAWSTLDDELRARLRIEEELMLPALELHAGREAACLRAEHHRILGLLDQLGVDLDLHQLDAERCREFLVLLRQHAERERRSLHPWADERLHSSKKGDVIWRLRRRRARPRERSLTPG